jgi:hypothetical protein
MSERLSAHLSDKSINDYLLRTMTPAELITTDDHLATCDLCYRRLSQSRDSEGMLITVDSHVLSLATSESGHLTYEQLASFVDAELDEVDREICDVHLQVCKQCSDELHDLSSFKAAISESVSIDRPVRAPSGWKAFVAPWRQLTSLQFAGAVAVVALLIAGVVWSVWMISRSRRPGITASTQSPTTVESPAPSVEKPNQVAPPVASPQIVLTLNDGGTQVTLDKEGNLAGLADLSPSHQQAVRTVLLNGRLNTPRELAELSGQAGILMGGKAEGVSFALLNPVGVIVGSTRPTFNWQPLAGTSDYVVNVYDTSFTKVASSPQLSINQWTIPEELSRGTVYLWQVTANKDGKEIKSPVKPAPEARFKILEKAQADELERVRRSHPNFHLLLGTLYEQAGLLDEAEDEFRALLVANPSSPVVQKLLRNVRALKRS